MFSGHLDGITYIDSKNDARYLISNSKDQSIKLWDMRMFSPSGNTNQSSRRRTRYYNRWDYRWDTVPKECKYLRFKVLLIKLFVQVLELKFNAIFYLKCLQSTRTQLPYQMTQA